MSFEIWKRDVIIRMTPAEYVSRRAAGEPVRLFAWTNPNRETYTEDDIPAIIADAGNSAALGREPLEHPLLADSGGWPFGIKAGVLAAAERGWRPKSEYSDSRWESFRDDPLSLLLTAYPGLASSNPDSAKAVARLLEERPAWIDEPRAVLPPEKHWALARMSLEEYEGRRGCVGETDSVLLVEWTKYAKHFYTELEIPRMVEDAVRFVSYRESVPEELFGLDIGSWSGDMKSAAMESAYKDWMPERPWDSSGWSWLTSKARVRSFLRMARRYISESNPAAAEAITPLLSADDWEEWE